MEIWQFLIGILLTLLTVGAVGGGIAYVIVYFDSRRR